VRKERGTRYVQWRCLLEVFRGPKGPIAIPEIRIDAHQPNAFEATLV
jgi:hypothetical protein